MQLRSERKQTKAASPVPSSSPVVSPFQVLSWLKLPLLCTSWTLPRALFSGHMVEQEHTLPPGKQQQQKPQAQQMPNASSDAAGSEPVRPPGTRLCYVSTSKGSQMVLFFSSGTDAKHILSEIVKRHNAQFKELGRVKSKQLAVCMHAEDRQGYKLTNDMILQDFAPNQDKVYLYAYTEDATLAAKRAAPAVGEGDAQAPKKAKAATPANGAASGSGATPAEGGKKRGRPTNKEKAEKEAAAAAKAAAEGKPSGDDKAKAPAAAQVAHDAKPAAAKPAAGAAKPSAKKETKSKQAAQATPTELKQPTKASAKAPAPTSAAKKEESSSEESGSGSEEESSSGDESSEEEEDKSPQGAQKKESSEEESSSEEE